MVGNGLKPFPGLSMRLEIEELAKGWQGTCGIGSIPENLGDARKAVREAIEHTGAKVINDAGCGDTQWVGEIEGYQGYDFFKWVEGVIELDYTAEKMRPCDLILCRFSLIHLPADNVLSALNLFKETADYLLASNYPRTKAQPPYSIHGTQWNLTNNPFSLGQPIRRWNDYKSDLALWQLRDKHNGLFKP